MNYLSTIPLVIAAGWGIWCIFRTVSSNSFDIIGEGQFVLLISIAPLIVVGLIHSALSSSYRSLSLLYSGWVAVICLGIGIAYWTVFGFGLRETSLGVICLIVLFGGSLLLFRAIPWLREKAGNDAN